MNQHARMFSVDGLEQASGPGKASTLLLGDESNETVRHLAAVLDEQRCGPRCLSPGDVGLTTARASGATPETVVIPGADGVHLTADVYRTRAASPRGSVVFVHGFCGNRTENGLFRTLAAETSAAGFDAVLYDWRGLNESQGHFPSTTLSDHVADFRRVVQWTRARAGRGSAPLHAVGFSLGAAVVGLALDAPTPVDSVTYLSPAVRPRLSMWPRYDIPEIKRDIRNRGLSKKPGSDVFLGESILHSLRDTDLGDRAFDIGVPLLVCHGTADTRIACSHTHELVAARGLGRDFAYMQLGGASHSFRPAERCWRVLSAALTGWFGQDRRPHPAALDRSAA